MSILTTIKAAIEDHELHRLTRRSVLLAYLSLHIQNKGLHPDNDVCEESGYEVWQAILVHSARDAYGDIPDAFTYPCSMMKLEDTLTALPCTPIEELGMVNSILDWLREDMQPSELDDIIIKLHCLYAYYDDGCGIEEETPAGILKTCTDVLLWVQQQS